MTAHTTIRTLLGLLLATAIVCGAQRAVDDTPPSASFAPFPLPLKRAYVFSAVGTPAAKAQLNTPFPDDFPPSLTLMFEDVRKFPSGQGRYYFPSRNVVRVYRISHAEAAPYKTIQSDIKSLRKLLSDRPSVVSDDDSVQRLPDYPPRNAGHCFAVKLSYIDAGWGDAVCYVTQFTQDGGTPANNEELTYIVRGLSKDGEFYVSADFSITHPKLPNRIQDTPERGKGDYEPDRALLSKQSDGSFTPALDQIRTWLATLELK
jgi:hypothetical protein